MPRLTYPPSLARQVMILLEGAIALMLVHRDVSYATAAGMPAPAIGAETRAA